ncbi:MAG: cytochrome C oxidase subunit IV family protein [Acidimicrobiales bacterium]
MATASSQERSPSETPAPDAGAVTDDAAATADPTTPGHAHPSEAQYVGIALILACITAVEVGVYYLKALKGALVPILLVLAITKFTMVVAWFMHLRFDSRTFRRLFVLGVLLALFVYTVVLTTFHVWTRGGG